MKSVSPKVRIITLGCKVNQCDGEELARALAQMGHFVGIWVANENPAGVGTPALQETSPPATPVFVVNTCSVTSTAEAKARKLIRRIAKENPQARIIVTGCYAERAPQEIVRLSGNITVVPNSQKPRLAEMATSCRAGVPFSEPQGQPTPVERHGTAGLAAPPYIRNGQLTEETAANCRAGALTPAAGIARKQASAEESESKLSHSKGLPPADGGVNCRARAPLGSVASAKEAPPAADAGTTMQPLSGRTRAFVKVQDGCDHACAFCIVNSLRGPMRSKPLAQAVGEISSLCEAGAREVVLCGIRLGAYGADFGNGESLANLLRALREIPLPRLRLSSIEHLDVTESLIAEFADHPSLCHHLHLPLQSGDDGVLAEMARGYSLGDYRSLVERVRRAWPDLSVTTDVMVGFPGESEAAFENTLAAIREFDFAKVHVFRYSPRPGTPAAAMKNRIPEQVKRKRMEAVQRMAEELFQRRAQRMRGEILEVLVEQKNPASGRWEGLTPHYLRVEISADEEAIKDASGQIAAATCPTGRALQPGEIVRARITGAEKDCLIGELTFQ